LIDHSIKKELNNLRLVCIN